MQTQDNGTYCCGKPIEHCMRVYILLTDLVTSWNFRKHVNRIIPTKSMCALTQVANAAVRERGIRYCYLWSSPCLKEQACSKNEYCFNSF